MSTGGNSSFAEQVVSWQAKHGRHHLPWQQTRDPYRVWLSEIMLQQTQVSTVLGYYSRFLDRFPGVAALALASQDEVLGLWSGLGYYSRARNLHQCAQKVMAEHGGRFPSSAAVLATLPGIGRSTAGAIAAFCFSERVPILDANVKRVLTRFLGFEADLASAKNERALWGLAESLLPDANLEATMPRYTQGLMDLGASICSPKTPECGVCPVNSTCAAFKAGNPERYPVRTRKIARRSEQWYLLVLRDAEGRVWMQKRPDAGIWAGMYSVPIETDRQVMAAMVEDLSRQAAQAVVHELPPSLHVLTHRDLYLHPVEISGWPAANRLSLEGEWVGFAEWPALGLPAPIRKLLSTAQMALC